MGALPVLLTEFSFGALADLPIGQWVGLGVFFFLWFVGACGFGAGFAALLTDRRNSTPLHSKMLVPEWVRLFVVVFWMGAQVLYFCQWATIPWWQVMIWGISIGIAFFILGEIAYAMGRPQFFVIAAIIGGVCWYTWPKPKEYALVARDTAVFLGNGAFEYAELAWAKGREWWEGSPPPTLAMAQAELELNLNRWKQGELAPYVTFGPGFYKSFGDAHQGSGFQLLNWYVGPGRQLEEGVYEFRISLEVQKYGNLSFRTYFPEKTVTVVQLPDSKGWACFSTGGIPAEPEPDSLAEVERRLMEAAGSTLEAERDTLLLLRRGRVPGP